MPLIDSSHSSPGKDEKPCRTCVDFKTWAKAQRKSTKKADDTNKISGEIESKKSIQTPLETNESPKPNCPLDKDGLGRSTWNLLHTIAAYYPDTPNEQQQRDTKQFFSSLSRLYPCEYCAQDMQIEIKKEPPVVKSQESLSQWLCQFHNKVNVKLGKPVFDCSKVNERWRDGWLDGSCD